ncbi:hypothetical protein L596_017159 [Steinernema carpocapsae]|uniref:Uncharacterized protein n=1 Tax=Steinernema carpocapsae TaxID=34508 RepID=A0A4U5N128_STECR|nr:hypothetical protein L596_017159 [Steinernema carpocapsae]
MGCRLFGSYDLPTIRAVDGIPEFKTVTHHPLPADIKMCADLDQDIRDLVRWSGIPSALAFSAHSTLKKTLDAKFAAYHIYCKRLDNVQRSTLSMMTSFELLSEYCVTLDKVPFVLFRQNSRFTFLPPKRTSSLLPTPII